MCCQTESGKLKVIRIQKSDMRRLVELDPAACDSEPADLAPLEAMERTFRFMMYRRLVRRAAGTHSQSQGTRSQSLLLLLVMVAAGLVSVSVSGTTWTVTLNIDDDIAIFVMALPSLYLVLSLVAGTMRAALVWLILGLGVCAPWRASNPVD